MRLSHSDTFEFSILDCISIRDSCFNLLMIHKISPKSITFMHFIQKFQKYHTKIGFIFSLFNCFDEVICILDNPNFNELLTDLN